ncbi:MAG: carboxypeptidase regulatory-like domain-containing protein [Anaerolineales bacterium]
MKNFAPFLWLALVLAACTSAQNPVLTSVELPASVQMTFNALLPPSSPSGETVYFTLLDEVTGLEFNRQALDLTSSGEHSASIILSVPTGTLVKYRYTRQATTGFVNEASADGSRISYRAYLVDGPGHVAYDMVAAWADQPDELATGQVSGTVTDAESGQPISNQIVVAAGLHARTNGEGRFLVTGLPQGLHNILVYSPSGNHLPFQQGALVAAGSETPANIQLNPTESALVTFWVTPPQEHTSSTPVFMIGDINALAARPLLSLQADGRYTVTMQLPTGVDIRYKYSLGDGLWNAEHVSDGDFHVRQLLIPAGTQEIEIEDQIAAWEAGSSAPIWFELNAPADNLLAYIQFNLGEWSTPLPMWPLGEGHWAYKLYSPTNFADPLEYRYCIDAACGLLEASPGTMRTVSGNSASLQQMKDLIGAWHRE